MKERTFVACLALCLLATLWVAFTQHGASQYYVSRCQAVSCQGGLK